MTTVAKRVENEIKNEAVIEEDREKDSERGKG